MHNNTTLGEIKRRPRGVCLGMCGGVVRSSGCEDRLNPTMLGCLVDVSPLGLGLGRRRRLISPRRHLAQNTCLRHDIPTHCTLLQAAACACALNSTGHHTSPLAYHLLHPQHRHHERPQAPKVRPLLVFTVVGRPRLTMRAQEVSPIQAGGSSRSLQRLQQTRCRRPRLPRRSDRHQGHPELRAPALRCRPPGPERG